MARFSEYDDLVKRLNVASIVAFALVLLFALTPGVSAQINGVPSSVTSIGFGGNPGSLHGTAPSVTSLGPRGYTPGFHGNTPGAAPPPTNFNLFGVNPGNINGHHHPHGRGYFPYSGYYAVPYYGYYDNSYDNGYNTGDQAEVPPADQYNGGPTVFDRRGPGTNASSPYSTNAPALEQQVSESTPAPEPPPASDQPATVLVFKDGHQVEVANYAIVGSTLYDLSDGRRHRIALADLDLTATAKMNEDRGLDFQVPTGAQAN